MHGVSNLEWISQLKGSMNALGTPLDGDTAGYPGGWPHVSGVSLLDMNSKTFLELKEAILSSYIGFTSVLGYWGKLTMSLTHILNTPCYKHVFEMCFKLSIAVAGLDHKQRINVIKFKILFS